MTQTFVYIFLSKTQNSPFFSLVLNLRLVYETRSKISYHVGSSATFFKLLPPASKTLCSSVSLPHSLCPLSSYRFFINYFIVNQWQSARELVCVTTAIYFSQHHPPSFCLAWVIYTRELILDRYKSVYNRDRDRLRRI